MSKGLLGRKVGMTQVFNAQGCAEPVTIIHAGPCLVQCVRTVERDGYSAVQLGYGERPGRLASSRGSAGVVSAVAKRFVREVRTGVPYSCGQELTVDELVSCRRVDVVGTSKGRGFAGVMKRHNFGGVCASHGVKKVHRSGGSTGQSTDPGKVFKGTKMPGRWGASRVTVRGLRVVAVESAENLLLVHGAVPGYSGGFLVVRETNCC